MPPSLLKPNPDGIPAELKMLRRWVNWRLEKRDGKFTKVPYVPGTNRRADSTEPDTWRTFDAAWESYQNGGRFDGVGFVFAKDDPYTGIDLDKCLGPDGLEDWAAKIVSALDSYTEVSPSGTGLHIIVRGKKPGKRCRKGKIEIYDQKRYLAITGRDFGGES